MGGQTYREVGDGRDAGDEGVKAVTTWLVVAFTDALRGVSGYREGK